MNAVQVKEFEKIEQVLIQGDLSKLSAGEKVNFYNRVCHSLGLNPLTKPFEYLKLNGREILYARRDATDQLRTIKGVSITSLDKETIGDLLIVKAKAVDKNGREDMAVGAVNLKGLSGENLANAYMKAETKAKRRVTLSICGLGLLDETEIEDAQATATRMRELTSTVQSTSEAPAFEGADYYVELEAEAAGVDPNSPAEYVIQVGKKYKGKKLKDIPNKDLESFADWISQQTNPHRSVQECGEKIREYLIFYASQESQEQGA